MKSLFKMRAGKNKNRWVLNLKKYGLSDFHGHEVTIYNEHNIRIIFCGYCIRTISLEFVFKIINNSEHKIKITSDNLSINNETVEASIYEVVNKYSASICKLDCKKPYTENEIGNIAGELSLSNNFSYDFSNDGFEMQIPYFLNLKNEPGDGVIYQLTINPVESLEYQELKADYLKLKEKRDSEQEKVIEQISDTWLAAKDIQDNLMHGMEALYKVLEQKETESTDLKNSNEENASQEIKGSNEFIKVEKEDKLILIRSGKHIHDFVEDDEPDILTEIIYYYALNNIPFDEDILLKLMAKANTSVDKLLCFYGFGISYYAKYGTEEIREYLCKQRYCEELLNDPNENIRNQCEKQKDIIDSYMKTLKEMCGDNDFCIVSKTKVELKRAICKCGFKKCNPCGLGKNPVNCCPEIEDNLELLMTSGFIKVEDIYHNKYKISIIKQKLGIDAR